MSNLTTIQLTKQTREDLKKQGQKGETYDEIIVRLLKNRKDQTATQTPVKTESKQGVQGGHKG